MNYKMVKINYTFHRLFKDSSRLCFIFLLFCWAPGYAMGNDYRLEKIFYNGPESTDSMIMMNGEALREGDQIGKYGVEKIEMIGVFLRDKISGKVDYFQLPGTPGATEPPPIDLPVEIIPKDFQLPPGEDKNKLPDMVKKVLQKQAVLAKIEAGQSPSLSELDLGEDAALTLALFVGLNSAGDIHDPAMNAAIGKFMDANPPKTKPFEELLICLRAAMMEETKNCMKILDIYKAVSPEKIQKAESQRLQSCRNFFKPAQTEADQAKVKS